MKSFKIYFNNNNSMKIKNILKSRRETMHAGLFVSACMVAGMTTAESALVSMGGPSLTSSTTVANSVNVDLDGNLANDLLFVFFGQGNLVAQGLGGAGFAGAVNGGSFIVTAYDETAGFTVGPSTNFGGGQGFSPAFGDLAAEASTPALGEWAGGEDAYFGFVFKNGSDDHYGYGRLVYNPTETTDTSSMNIVELVYESTPGLAVTVVPEPSAVLLGGLGFFGMLLRRKRAI
ncbi:PEP-CTERM sorting domain-containing protein [Roseibacillus persicicus]|uniref:PEP-CTERM sorting domain-containing protein n=1 Tax=Roseibacillus persicicus TaxID=454148 RepID=UPI0028103621|nr:PEP-CTERM sorting domain-containing protein [Roseibacillus persicicus]MDQ8190609.1 PEP-CTERM sorting domain-containing protein [Roseibacillus persicicus]